MAMAEAVATEAQYVKHDHRRYHHMEGEGDAEAREEVCFLRAAR